MFTDIRSGMWKGEVQAFALLLLFMQRKKKLATASYEDI